MDRLGPEHFGVRFNTHVPTMKWRFEVDGVAIPEVIEGKIGDKGWVYHHPVVADLGTKAHVCRNCRINACVRYTHGYLRVWRDGTEVTTL
jgi:hypothetical protein